MSRKRRDADYLGDMIEAMQRIGVYTGGLSYEQFLEDQRTQDAVLRNLEVLGEAAKGLSPALKKSHPALPWKDMAGMRDKLIHHYFGSTTTLSGIWPRNRFHHLSPVSKPS